MASVPSPQQYFWQETSIIALALTFMWAVILWPLASEDTSNFLASVLAGTSGLLLAMSFSLSSFSYYFNFLDAKVVYRKYLGLMGYFFALGYVAVTVASTPQTYLSAFPANLMTIDIGFGTAAMGILTVMALISHNRALRFLGGKLWKNILGLGYIAYALLVIRAIFLDAWLWQAWFDGGNTFTVRMMLTVLGTAVLFFRVSVPIHKKFFNTTQYV